MDQEHHAEGELSRFGIWVEGQFSWLSDANWDRSLDYAGDTLVLTVEECLAKLRRLNRCPECDQPLFSVDDDV